MAIVLAGFTMSLDGFIADPDDNTENLFEWFNSGDTEYVFPDGKMTVRLSPASTMVMRDIWQTVGAIVVGRRMFDIAHGWGGNHPLNVPVFVVSHSTPELPEGWPRDDAPFTFVTGVADGVESAVERAIEQAKKVAGEKMVIVAGANVAQQALKAGLVDELELDLVPVLLGRGIRAFEYLGVEPIKLERTIAVLAPDVTHLRFRVTRMGGE